MKVLFLDIDGVVNNLYEHPEVTKHAILDDNADFHADQPLFKTSWSTGLTDEIAAAVITYLNAPAQTVPEMVDEANAQRLKEDFDNSMTMLYHRDLSNG